MLDKSRGLRENTQAFDVRPYLSWIEELTTNQNVGGSNPSGRTTSFSFFKSLIARLLAGFLLLNPPLFQFNNKNVSSGFHLVFANVTYALCSILETFRAHINARHSETRKQMAE